MDWLFWLWVVSGLVLVVYVLVVLFQSKTVELFEDEDDTK